MIPIREFDSNLHATSMASTTVLATVASTIYSFADAPLSPDYAISVGFQIDMRVLIPEADMLFAGVF
jgi:hypothetical protein